jgi:hypothetical protein
MRKAWTRDLKGIRDLAKRVRPNPIGKIKTGKTKGPTDPHMRQMP